MDSMDLSSGECLRILLEEQTRNLRIAADQLDLVWRSSSQETQPAQWSGDARIGHDKVVEKFLATLLAASHAVSSAADQSARAAGTLSNRVG